MQAREYIHTRSYTHTSTLQTAPLAFAQLHRKHVRLSLVFPSYADTIDQQYERFLAESPSPADEEPPALEDQRAAASVTLFSV